MKGIKDIQIRYPAAALCAAIALLLAAGSCSAKEPAPNAGRYAGAPAVDMSAQYGNVFSANVRPQGAVGLDRAVQAEEAADAGGPDSPGAGAGPGADAELPRKLVRRANISIRVQEPEKAGAAVTDLMEQYGAYASAVNIWENSRHYTIRVPAASYTSLLSALDGMGRLLHRSESAEDVTIRYYDLEGRLATKRELLKTYRSYLGRAGNIEEILSVEAKIAELEADIDGTGKELRSLANRVDYATVELEIQGPESIPAFAAPTLGERIRGLFGSLGGFFSAALLFLLGIIVYGIPCLLFLALIFWLLFGRIGLLKKLWRLVVGKSTGKGAAPLKTGRPRDKQGTGAAVT
ncbi:MAG: DUF4349 domain-containing protein [Treponema sp.]|jgi:hypothetical protein|nr:DUF4349 domain-containing protein [Treponema sp.]